MPLKRSHIPIMASSLSFVHDLNSKLFKVAWNLPLIKNTTSSSTCSFIKLRFKCTTESHAYRIPISLLFGNTNESRPLKLRTLILESLELSSKICVKQLINPLAQTVVSKTRGNLKLAASFSSGASMLLMYLLWRVNWPSFWADWLELVSDWNRLGFGLIYWKWKQPWKSNDRFWNICCSSSICSDTWVFIVSIAAGFSLVSL